MARAARPKVLLVEDEPSLRALTAERLRDAGFDVIEAAAAEPAIALLQHESEIEVVFSDVHMPGPLDGVGLARAIRRTHPHLPLILTSGQWVAQGDEAPEGVVFVPKPYSLDAVAELVKAMLEPD